jgi:hypothetical protein
MSHTTRYLDLYSFYRNRFLYPNPCDFKVNNRNQFGNTASTSTDPVYASLPVLTGLANTIAPSASTKTTIYLDPTTISSLIASDDHYLGYTIKLPTGAGVPFTWEYRKITSYIWSSTAPYVTLDSALSNAPSPGTNRYYIGTNIDQIFMSGTVGASTASTIDVWVSQPTNFYQNYYILISNHPLLGGGAEGQYRRIISSAGSVVTVSPAFSVAPTAGNDLFEIYTFTRDNAFPLSGTISSLTQPSPHMMKLTHLSVPATPILNGKGFVYNLPFIYVEISVENSTYDQVVFSNSPNTSKILFKVPVDYTPGVSSYVQLVDTNMGQTVNFRVVDNLHFRILTPDGVVPNFGNDFMSPCMCDERLQVSCIVEFTRLV